MRRFLVIVGLVLLAAGCGSSGDNGSDSNSSGSGAEVWAKAGCGSCHTFKAAQSNGAVGPNLDDLKPSFDQVKHQVTHGGGGMPSFKGELSAKESSSGESLKAG